LLDEKVLDKLLDSVELGLGKRLSEAIGHIFFRAHVVELKSAAFVDTFTDKKVTYVDVLATTVTVEHASFYLERSIAP